VLLNAVQGISDLIQVHGLVNVDFADVRTIMGSQGMALMGTGRSSGSRRAMEAMQAAISSPLLEDITLDGATGLLVNITGGPSLTLHEVNEAVTMAQTAADADANIIFGSVVDDRLGDEVKITVIATGFAQKDVPIRNAQPPWQQPIPQVAQRPAAAAAATPAPAAHAAHTHAAHAAPPAQAPAPAPAEVARATVAARAPIRLAQPVPAAVAPRPPALPTRRDGGGFKPLDEDQYDIPAFLRKGGQQNP
jgi:cell division protein FtsZ